MHEKFGSESVRLADTLPRKVLYLLARESTPDEVREEAIERAEAGERLTLAEVKEKIEAGGGKGLVDARHREGHGVEFQHHCAGFACIK